MASALAVASLVALAPDGGTVAARPLPQAGQPPQQQQQQPPPTTPPHRSSSRQTFRAGVKLVRVDVSVTGSGDKPVTDLTAADFDVTEDGVPQKVETAQFIRLDGQRSRATNLSRDPLRDHALAEAAVKTSGCS